MTREEVIEELEYIKDGLVSCELSYVALDMAIKALNQEPCEDCVSRQAIVEYIKGSEADLGHDLENELVVKDILNMPSVTPTQRWIPVSERLPKPGEYIDDVAKYYLVQNEYGDMLVARYTHSEYWEQIYRMEPIDDEVVAWMPLPKQYKAEMESNACKDCYYNDGEVHAECVVCGKAEMESEE